MNLLWHCKVVGCLLGDGLLDRKGEAMVVLAVYIRQSKGIMESSRLIS